MEYIFSGYFFVRIACGVSLLIIEVIPLSVLFKMECSYAYRRCFISDIAGGLNAVISFCYWRLTPAN